MADIFGFGGGGSNLGFGGGQTNNFGFGTAVPQTPILSPHQVNAYKTLLSLSSPQERAQRLQQLQQAAQNNPAAAELHAQVAHYNVAQPTQGFQPSIGDKVNNFWANDLPGMVTSLLPNQTAGGDENVIRNAQGKATGQFNTPTGKAASQKDVALKGVEDRLMFAKSLPGMAGVTAPVVGNIAQRAVQRGLQLAPQMGLAGGVASFENDGVKRNATQQATHTIEGVAGGAAQGFGFGAGGQIAGDVGKAAFNASTHALEALSQGHTKSAEVAAKTQQLIDQGVPAGHAQMLAQGGQDGFIASPFPKFEHPVNENLNPAVLPKIAEVQKDIQNAHVDLARHRDAIEYAKETINANPNISKAQRDAAIKQAYKHNTQAVADTNKQLAQMHDRLTQLDPSGNSRPLKVQESQGVAPNETTLLQQQAAEDEAARQANRPFLQKAADSLKQTLSDERGSARLDLGLSGDGKEANAAPKPVGEQIGRLKAAINKETDPNVKAELAGQLKDLNRQYSTEKSDKIAEALGLNPEDRRATSAPVDKSKPTKLKMAEEAIGKNNAEDMATAKAIEEQRGAPAPISLPKVAEGDVKQAVLNSRAAPSLIRDRALPAVKAARKLSKNDHALLDDLRTTDPSVLARKAEDPKAFLDAAKKAKEFNDYTHALGTGSGQAIKYRENYGASELWDLSDKKTADILEQYEAKLKNKPGYSKERLIPDYRTGEKLGMKRLNANFAGDLVHDAKRRESDIAELALAKGLEQAYPHQVAIGTIPRGYTALQIAHGRAIAMPSEIADKINRRGVAPKVENPLVKGYDATNRGLKYIELGGGTFHALTTAESTAGQQLMSANLLKHPIQNLHLITGTLSRKAHDLHVKAWAENGDIHPDGLSTIDRAHIAGVTLRASEILGDANVKLIDNAKGSRLNFIKNVHDMVFERQIPEAKQMIFEQATRKLDTNNPAHLERMRQVASAVNNLGGINRAVEGITPKGAQQLSRFVLATDFTETKLRKIGAALTSKGADGKIARQMVVGKVLVAAMPGLIVAGMSGMLKTPQDWANELIKQALDPQIKTNIDDGKGGTKVAKLPGTEVSELGRIFLPMFTDQKNRMSGVEHYVTARTSAGLSTIWSLISNKDYFGAPVIATNKDGGVDVGKTVGNLATSKSPIPISQGIKYLEAKQGATESLLNTAGLRVTQDPATKTNPNPYGLTDATGTPEAKKAAADKKVANAKAVLEGSRLGGTTSLDSAQTRIDNAQKNLPSGISDDSKQILLRYAKLSTEGKAKFDADPINKTRLDQAKFEQDTLGGKLSSVQQFTKQQALTKESVTSGFSPDVVQFYGMSKAEQKAYMATNPDGAALYQQAQQLDQQLGADKYKYGLGTKPKKGRKVAVPRPRKPKAMKFTGSLASSHLGKALTKSIKAPNITKGKLV